MLNSKQNLSREVVILFSKPDSNSQDGRNMAQGAILTVHQQYHNETPWDASSAVEDGRLGPCDLVKVSDLIGYDDATRPGASARAEQKLGSRF